MNAQGSGVGRAEFVGRVSRVLGHREVARPDVAPPVVDPAIARVTGVGEDLVGVFAARAVKTGMVVHRVRAGESDAFVVGLLGKLGVRRVAVSGAAGMSGISGAVQAGGFEVVMWDRAGSLASLYDVDAGVTDVQAGIAETGSLVCWSGAGRGRGLSLVPPLHVAVVRASQIVPDLIDYLGRHAGEAELPSSVVLITGPSKTADIEGVLITGVHGPREVHLVVEG